MCRSIQTTHSKKKNGFGTSSQMLLGVFTTPKFFNGEVSVNFTRDRILYKSVIYYLGKGVKEKGKLTLTKIQN